MIWVILPIIYTLGVVLLGGFFTAGMCAGGANPKQDWVFMWAVVIAWPILVPGFIAFLLANYAVRQLYHKVVGK